MKYITLLLISSLWCAAQAETPAPPKVEALDRGYAQMYNLQFVEAHRTFQEFQRLHPQDPMGPVSDSAAYLFSEFDRLHILQSEFFTHDQHFITDHKLTPDPALKQNFLAAIQASRALAARAPGDNNALFAAILCDGLESDYSALIEKRYRASFLQMKSGRAMAERLLAQDATFYDAWLAVGVENYMLSIKPAPVRWLLRLGGGETNRAVGIEKLRLTAEKGHYLAPFARLLLAVVALRDQDNGRARELLAGLVRDYPNNPLYRQELSRVSTLASRSVPE
jgi:hypothetical protein